MITAAILAALAGLWRRRRNKATLSHMDEMNQSGMFGGESVTFGDDVSFGYGYTEGVGFGADNIDAGDGQDDMMAQLEGAIDFDPYAIGQGLIPNDPMMNAFEAAASNDPYAIGQSFGL